MEDNKKNFFYLHDKKIFKIFWWVTSAFLAIAFVAFIVMYGSMVIDHLSGNDNVEPLFPAIRPFIDGLLIALFIVFIAFITVFIYNYVSNAARYAEENETETEKVICPLFEDGVRHETEIYAMLKTIARPDPGTNKLNRANTVHFIRTLNELNLIDPNVSNKHLMLWVEQVTGYEEKSLSAFGQALDKQKANPKLVAEYRKQLEQILAE